MFNKSVKVKSNNQVKASERKNIKAKVHSCFPDISEVDLNILLPNKPINVLKVLTHNSVDVIVYAVEKRVVFFEIEKVLYPSIYTLWKHPDILLSFTTHVPVLSKLMQGADLMIPGVVLPENIEGPAAWGKFEKDQIVSINLTNNKASIAVGKTCHSSMDMYMAAGRGRCIEIIHVLGDELCSLLAPAIPTPDLGHQIILDNINLSTDNPTENNIENIALVEASTSEQCESKHMSSADVDALLRYTFLKCLNTE
ncbi:eukaryotic translation initiation factor 2D-like, partial [Ctenocephalides felis]|uniref:eukaryotic translation initiation factor 2D-like n=1 Tax=Ctenocephalides felis TaxID=7515 RepID=UPI000E6E3AC4